mmetsp:Transcript_7253/g.11900  ORF Transcript_7253/g.11900 Transcript_7253/m.11900 type:complete len:1401 (+) Transcript_7253:1066-5268(+)
MVTHAEAFVLNNSPHPILDGVENKNNDENIIRPKQEYDNDANKSTRKRRLYSSESDFVAQDNQQPTPPAPLPDRVGSTDAKAEEDNTNTEEHDDQSTDDEQGDLGEGVHLQTLDTYVEAPPDYTKANSISFKMVCDRLEQLWIQRSGKGKRKVTKQEKLAYLMPKTLLKFLEGGSPYPYLRLIMPASDSTRPHTGLKEAKIIQTYKQAMNLPRDGKSAKSMDQWRDSNMTGKQAAGDISLVIENVLKERMPCSGSKLTVGEINEWLDVVALVTKTRFNMPTEEVAEKSKWRRDLEKAIAGGRANEKRQDKHVRLIERLMNKNFSPLEHKWIVRLLLQHIHIGLNLRDILGYWHPHAMEMYNSNNKLESVCSRLSDPVYLRLLNAKLENSAEDALEGSRADWMTRSTLPAKLQQTISPMLSLRTSFETFLTEVADRHHKLDNILPDEASSKSCLAIRHPAFACEIKMDGERDLIHIKRGEVTIQTRNNVWYSPLYSPALGPYLRKALRYDVDVILDGEVLAWDTEENKPVPFGANRAVAEMQRARNMRDGISDDRDWKVHENETGINVMTLARDKQFGNQRNPQAADDRTLWLKYSIFDILYVAGPGTAELMSKSSHLLSKEELAMEGSIINLDCMQRKSIIYNLIEPQKNIVEPIKSIIVRPDGSSVDAADYFLSKSGLEYGKTPCELDSIHIALSKTSDMFKFDSQRMDGRTHEDIEKQRALELEKCFHQIVEVGGQEGLVLKDLASPYYLGVKSRSMGYWWKIKSDYDASGVVSDVDVVVLGGRYAASLHGSGMIDSILVGCIDDQGTWGMTREGPPQYLTLCQVNFNRKDRDKILEQCTGFKRADNYNEMKMGKWFTVEDKSWPDFVSSRSFQRDVHGDLDGWKSKPQYVPDVWIKPEDSFVVTLNAAEIIASESFSAGLSLRFPRVKKVRAEGFDDPKPHDQVAEFKELLQIFEETEDQGRDVEFGSQAEVLTSRFLTQKEYESSGKHKKRTNSRKEVNAVKALAIPSVDTIQSIVLEGYIFDVMPGRYCLEDDVFVAAEAKEHGWAEVAKNVKTHKDVEAFIKSHGGTCILDANVRTDFILGGSPTDAKVSNKRNLMENADEEKLKHSTSMSDAVTRRLFEIGGVLKWTFVYSLVTKFLSRLKDESSGFRKSIKEKCPGMATPRHSDFLVMAKSAKESLKKTEDEFGLRIHDICNDIDFERALEGVGRQRAINQEEIPSKIVPWQINAMTDFNVSERWVFRGKAQKLWPYQKDAQTTGTALCTLYPDLFDDPGFEEEVDAKREDGTDNESIRWEDASEIKNGAVAASLPLATAMGAIVTPHLHNSVTHVLCELKRHKSLEWTATLPRSIFTDPECAARIHERLISLEDSAGLKRQRREPVLLVSPAWMDEKWVEA